MAWRCSATSNTDLVENLTNSNIITHSRVKEAMLSVDRAHFVPPGGLPYQDSPQVLIANATISAPHMHAMCMSALSDVLIPGARALDVGSGSGYLLAAMARMVVSGDTISSLSSSSATAGGAVADSSSSTSTLQGSVHGIEHIPELVSFANANLTKDPTTSMLVGKGIITNQVVDGFLGLPSRGPYDAIHVGAAAPTVPTALVLQLKVGSGKMVIPVGTEHQELLLIERTGEETMRTTSLMDVRYIPLTSREAQIGISGGGGGGNNSGVGAGSGSGRM